MGGVLWCGGKMAPVLPWPKATLLCAAHSSEASAAAVGPVRHLMFIPFLRPPRNVAGKGQCLGAQA